MVIVRRVSFTRKKIDALKRQLKSGKLPSWAKETQSKNGVLHIDGKEVVPKNEVDEWLRKRVYSRAKSPVPFSRDAGYDFLQRRTYGVSRREWFAWLKRQELHQKQTARPVAPTRPGQRIRSRGVLQMDLVEAKPKDLKNLGREKATYYFTLIDLLTGYIVVQEVRSKGTKTIAPALKKMLGKMEDALGKKVTVIQSDHGSEFKADTLRLMNSRGINWKGVRLGARIEHANSFFQRTLYSLIRQRRGGKLDKYIQDAANMMNETKSRITKFSPIDALAQPDTVLAKAFNSKRQAPGKHISKSVPLAVGDRVRVLKKAKKGDLGFKSYRAEHYGPPTVVTGKRGSSFKVESGRFYPRDRILKVPEVDKKSAALLQKREPQKPTPAEQKKHRTRRANQMETIKAKARVAPRRGSRVRKKRVR
jgi:hypothetical protein